MATRLQNLTPGEAIAKIGTQTVHLTTKRVAKPTCTREEYQAIADHYAQLLQRSATEVQAEVDEQVQQKAASSLSRRSPRRTGENAD